MVAAITLAATAAAIAELTHYFGDNVTRPMLLALPLMLAMIGLGVLAGRHLQHDRLQEVRAGERIGDRRVQRRRTVPTADTARDDDLWLQLAAILRDRRRQPGRYRHRTGRLVLHLLQPVTRIIQSCKTGAATNIITGLAVGLESCAVPILVIVIAIFVSIMSRVSTASRSQPLACWRPPASR